MTLVDRLFKTKKGDIVVAQFPSSPLILWGGFVLFSMFDLGNRLNTIVEYLSFSLIFTWAYLEIAEGVNLFRRLFGLLVLSLLILTKV